MPTPELIFAISFLEDGCLVSSHNATAGDSSLFVSSEHSKNPDNNRDFMHKSIMDFIDDEVDEKLLEHQKGPHPSKTKGAAHVK